MKLSRLAWVIAAFGSAYACSLAIANSTPVDLALPMIAAAITVVAAVSHSAIQVAVPILIVAEISIVDERTRLLLFGVIVGVAFAASLFGGVMNRWRAGFVTAAAIVVLRWIPYSDVMLPREIVLIAMCIAIVAALRWTAFGVVIAVLTALFTAAIPLRTFALPLCVLLLSGALRVVAEVSARPVRDWRALPALAISLPLVFFAWSGAFARSAKTLVRGPIHHGDRFLVQHALKPGESLLMDVPENARYLVLSGANMSKLKKKTVVGRIDPGNVPIRIGDFADWGAFRRDQFNASLNPLPAVPAGVVRDYGYSSWVDGAGKVRTFGTHMRITADASLPADARLQIEGFEWPR